MGMKISDIAIGGYLPGQSLLHKLDPRTKLLGIIFLTIAIFSASGPIEVIANTIPVMFAVLISRAGWRIWLWGVSRFFFMLVAAALLNTFFYRTGTPIVLGSWESPVSYEGLARGSLLSFKLLQAIMLSLALTLTTTPRDLTKGCEKLAQPLKKLRVPVEEAALTLLLAMRFVPLLQLELRNIVDAQKSRGIDFNDGNLKLRIENFLSVLVPALLATIKRADILADAMSARGFQPGQPRSEYKVIQFSNMDYLTLGIVLLWLILNLVF